MAKRAFVCSNCGLVTSTWEAKCPKCGEFGTLDRDDSAVSRLASTGTSSSGKAPSARSVAAATGNRPRRINEVMERKFERISTGIGEFDRVLGGGLVPGGVILLAGSPGAGKSTLLNSAAASIANLGKKVLYISGEETEEQIASRAKRIGAIHENVYLMSENSLPNALEAVQELKPDFFVIDSLQTLTSGDSESRMGSPTQVTDVAHGVTALAKRMGIPALIIGQVTKAEQIGGPRTIEHLVDVVLYFEANGDSPLRILRGIKNRFGAVDEVGVFQHVEDGFEEVDDPSGFFLSDHADDVTGYATTIVLEGNRALPIEVQALVAPTKLPNPRKISTGVDHGRSLMIQAILEKYAKLRLNDKDVYVSVTGGMTVKDSSIDLAIAAAIISSAKSTAVPEHSAFLGETTLTGEVRSARNSRKRAAEARRLGFQHVIEPHTKNSNFDPSHYNTNTIAELYRLIVPRAES